MTPGTLRESGSAGGGAHRQRSAAGRSRPAGAGLRRSEEVAAGAAPGLQARAEARAGAKTRRSPMGARGLVSSAARARAAGLVAPCAVQASASVQTESTSRLL